MDLDVGFLGPCVPVQSREFSEGCFFPSKLLVGALHSPFIPQALREGQADQQGTIPRHEAERQLLAGPIL